MRPRARPHINRQYFHTQPGIDKRDTAFLKKRIDTINQDKHKKKLKDKKRDGIWRI